jgi:hypothetical protein
VKDRLGALLVAVVVLMVCAALALKGVQLLGTGDLREVGLGVGILVLVAVGVVLVLGEVRLGAASARLGRRLEAEGGLPEDLPERRPSGRLPADAAQRQFARRKTETEAAPDDWRCWFRLALAYADARDTSAGRRAMRRAVALEAGDNRGRPVDERQR